MGAVSLLLFDVVALFRGVRCVIRSDIDSLIEHCSPVSLLRLIVIERSSKEEDGWRKFASRRMMKISREKINVQRGKLKGNKRVEKERSFQRERWI